VPRAASSRDESPTSLAQFSVMIAVEAVGHHSPAGDPGGVGLGHQVSGDLQLGPAGRWGVAGGRSQS